MQKNVAGQRIGVQMVSASDGSAFTGTVTVYVTGDAGSQAIGSVGSGVCTHEGNGYHSYTPAQTETNYDLIAFTFTGSGAVPVTVQVYTAINPVTAVPTAAAVADAVLTESVLDHRSVNNSLAKFIWQIRNANLTIEGAVSSAITPTTLAFSSNVSATTSAYAHAVLLFISGPLTGENSPIISYNSTNGVFVLEEPLTAAPSNGDEFVVIAGSHVHAIADIAAGVLASINGSGARTVTITVDDGTTALANALVRVVSNNETYVVGTNVSGVAVFNLDDATWVVSITKPGYTFAGASLVVDGTESVTYSMSLVTITPSSTDKVTGYWTVLDENGNAAASVVVTLKTRQPLRGGVGIIHDAGERTATSNGSGLVQFTNLIPGWRYAVVANDDYVADFVVPADAVTSVELGSIVARLP